MQLNIVLRTDTNDLLSIIFEGSAEEAKVWADDLLTEDAEFSSALIATRKGAELFTRSSGGVWGTA